MIRQQIEGYFFADDASERGRFLLPRKDRHDTMGQMEKGEKNGTGIYMGRKFANQNQWPG